MKRFLLIFLLLLLPTTASPWCMSSVLQPVLGTDPTSAAITRILDRKKADRAFCKKTLDGEFPAVICQDVMGQCADSAGEWQGVGLRPRGTWQEETGEGFYQVFPGGHTVYCDRNFGCRKIMGVP